MTRWLVTGAAGMLGQDLTALLAAEDGEQLIPLTRAELDITDPAAVRASLDSYQPDVVVNCAAWTAVDEAEAQEQAAIQVNGKAVALLADACAGRGVTLVQLSTDYVFDGTAREPYREDHPAAPRTAYGRTKLAGERAVLAALPGTGYVVRTAWLYGAQGKSFVATMLGRARTASPVRVVDDQRGQPTWTADVARQVIALVSSAAAPGIYHATSSGQVTWFGLAREIFGLLGADPSRVRPIPSSAMPRPAPRPAYSVLGHGAWAAPGIRPIGEWRTALHRAFPALLAAHQAGAAAGQPSG